MMTPTSYLIALVVYALAAIVGCRMLYVLWFSRLSPVVARVGTGLVTGVLLAPSYAASEMTTLAPALVTGLFNLLFAGGMAAATPAFIMLFIGGILGVGGALLAGRLSTSRPDSA
jgi:hypothetical protein